MRRVRHQAWLGGVCARSADHLGWNVYGIRAAAVLLAWLAPLATGATYLLASWWLRREQRRDSPLPADHPTMAEWDRRMASLDRDWQRYHRH